jgi:hypothetical protein
MSSGTTSRERRKKSGVGGADAVGRECCWCAGEWWEEVDVKARGRSGMERRRVKKVRKTAAVEEGEERGWGFDEGGVNVPS